MYSRESSGKGVAALAMYEHRHGVALFILTVQIATRRLASYNFHISNGQTKQSAENKGSTTDKSHRICSVMQAPRI
jgi:hypothetical protein